MYCLNDSCRRGNNSKWRCRTFSLTTNVWSSNDTSIGPGEKLNPAKYNVADKYDAASIAISIATEVGSPEAKHLDNFFWGSPETMFDL